MPGEVYRFDARRDHPGLGSDNLVDGDLVYVLRGGTRIDYQGKPLQITQPRVRPATPEEIAAATPAPVPTVVVVEPLAPARLATMKIKDLRDLARERGIDVPTGTRKADLVKLLEQPGPDVTPSPAGQVAARLDVSDFDTRVARARSGLSVEDTAPVRVEVDASAGAETSKWKAVEARGFTGPAGGLLGAVTRRVRVSGPFNEHLRFPEGKPLEGYEARFRESLSPEQRAKFEAADAAARTKMVATAERDIKALDKAMDQSHLPSDVVVWRAAPIRDLGIPESGAEGFEWVDPAYAGTTGQREIAASFGDTLMRILAPEGTPGISIFGGGEGELLLARGLRYRVVHDTPGGKGRARVLDVEIIPESKHAVPAARSILAPDLDVTPSPTGAVVARSDASFRDIRSVESRLRARQVAIDEARGFGDVAIRLDEQVQNGASRRALLHTVNTMAERASGFSPEDIARLRALVDDPPALRAAAREIAGREGVEIVGATNDVVRYDRTLHEAIGGDLADGTSVTVVGPGSRLHGR